MTRKPIPGYAGYEVTADGKIFGPRGEMKQSVHPKRGYRYVDVDRIGMPRKLFVHKAILMAFVGPCPDGCECRHLNDDPADNRIENLLWGTRLENAADKRRNGGLPCGEKSGTAKLTEAQVLECRSRWPAESFRSLAVEFGVSHTAIRRAVHGMKWSHLSERGLVHISEIIPDVLARYGL